MGTTQITPNSPLKDQGPFWQSGRIDVLYYHSPTVNIKAEVIRVCEICLTPRVYFGILNRLNDGVIGGINVFVLGGFV